MVLFLLPDFFSHYHITLKCLPPVCSLWLTKWISAPLSLSSPSLPVPLQFLKMLLCHTSAEIPVYIYLLALCSSKGSSVIITAMSSGRGVSRFTIVFSQHICALMGEKVSQSDCSVSGGLWWSVEEARSLRYFCIQFLKKYVFILFPWAAFCCDHPVSSSSHLKAERHYC